MASPLFSQIPLRNPSIPSEERFTYYENFGGSKGIVTEELRLVSEKGKSWYEVIQTSPKVDTVFRLDAETLFPFYTETTTHTKDSVIKKSLDVVQAKGPFKPDDLLVSDPNALGIELRGFPWGKVEKAKLLILGQSGGQGMSFSLVVRGKEKVAIGAKVYECYKAQLSLDGFLGALIPKTDFWFLAAAPHYLVRFEGISGGPGSPKRILVLKNYEAGGAAATAAPVARIASASESAIPTPPPAPPSPAASPTAAAAASGPSGGTQR